jgi:hypothetical protein
MPPPTLKAQLSKSYCASYKWNPRNLERPWYSLWLLTLTQLTERFDNMIVVPQYPLWYVPQEGDSDSDGEELSLHGGVEGTVKCSSGVVQGFSDNDDPDIDPLDLFQYPEERDPDERLSPGQDDDTDCSPDVDLSSGSMITIPEGEASERFPDFAIIHVLAKRLPARFPRFRDLAGLQITHQCCAVVIENKASPSRKLSGQAFQDALDANFIVAQTDLGYQCHHLFKEFNHATSTIVVAAVGDYWVHRVVRRCDAPKVRGEFMDMAIWDELDWRPHVKLGTAASDVMLHDIEILLASKPLLDLEN